MKNPTTPTRVRLYTHVTQSRFLHIEDALNIGKLRLFAGTYRKGQGMTAHGHHFIDLADARVLFAALAAGEQGFQYREYKGSPPANGRAAVSRILSVAVKGENVFFELKSGPGKLMPTGAITPAGKPEVAINVGLKLHDGRRMAATVLAYLQAWDLLRMMAYKQVIGQPFPFEIVAAARENDVQNNSLHASPRAMSQRIKAINRPLTRKGSTAIKGIKRADFLYGDGARVDGNNRVEAQTYQQYLAENHAAPPSRVELLNFYQQRVHVLPIAASS